MATAPAKQQRSRHAVPERHPELVVDAQTMTVLPADRRPPTADRRAGIIGKRSYAAESAAEASVREVIEKTLESFREVRLRSPGELPQPELIRQVAETLADKAHAPADPSSAEEGWQQLLERGLQSKAALLRSQQFKSTAEASALLGIGEPAVRKRIREGRLFALRMSADDEHRIPAWALDSNVGQATSTIRDDAGGADDWRLYHFLSTPNGSLHGLRPFECLMAREHLPPSRQSARAELMAYLKMPANASLLEPVRRALKVERADRQRA